MKHSSYNLSFFKDAPSLGLWLHICSYLPPEDLLKKCRSTNRILRQAAILELCQRSDRASILCATELFQTNGSIIFTDKNCIRAEYENFIPKLNRLIQQNLASPYSKLKHKLSAVCFLSEANGISIQLPEHLVDKLCQLDTKRKSFYVLFRAMNPLQQRKLLFSILQALENENLQTKEAALSALSIISLHVNPKQFKKLIHCMVPMLHGQWDVYEVVRDTLLEIASQAENTQKAVLQEVSNTLVTHPRRHIANTAEQLLELVIPTHQQSLTEQEALDQVEAAKTQLINQAWSTQKKALATIGEMSRYIPKAQRYELCLYLLSILNDEDLLLFEGALKTIAAVSSHIDANTELFKLSQALFQKLYDTKESTLNHAFLQVFASIVPRANPALRNVLISSIINMLQSDFMAIENTMLVSIKQVLEYLNKKQLETCLNIATTVLTQKELLERYEYAALILLETIAKHLDEPAARAFISTLIEALADAEELIALAILRALALVAHFSDTAQIDVLIEEIPPILADSEDSARISARDILIKLAPQMNPLQMDKLIQSISLMLDGNTAGAPLVYAVPIVAAYAKPAQVDILIEKIVPHLSHQFEAIRNAALHALSTLMCSNQYAFSVLKNTASVQSVPENNTKAKAIFEFITDEYTKLKSYDSTLSSPQLTASEKSELNSTECRI